MVLIENKQKGIFDNDVTEVGYKYQMTDIAATLGYDSLGEFNKILYHRRKIYNIYLNELSRNKNIICINENNKKNIMLPGCLQLRWKKRIFFKKN